MRGSWYIEGTLQVEQMLSNSSFRQEFNVGQVFKIYGLSIVQEWSTESTE